MKRVHLLLCIVLLLAISPAHAQDGDERYVHYQFDEIGVSFDTIERWDIEVNQGDINTLKFYDGDVYLFNLVFLPRQLPDEMVVLEDSREGIASALSSHIALGFDGLSNFEFSPLSPAQRTHFTRMSTSQDTLWNYVIVEDDGIIWLPFALKPTGPIDFSFQDMYKVLETIEVDWSLALPGTPVSVEEIHQIAGTDRVPDFTAPPANTSLDTVDGVTTEVRIQPSAHINWSTLYAPEALNEFVLEMVLVEGEYIITSSVLPRDLTPGYYPTTLSVIHNPGGTDRVYGLLIIESVEDNSISGQYIGYTDTGSLHGHFVDVSLETVDSCRKHAPENASVTVHFENKTFAGLTVENETASVWLETLTNLSDARFNLFVEIAPGMTLQLTLADENAPTSDYTVMLTDFMGNNQDTGMLRLHDTDYGVEGKFEVSHEGDTLSGEFSGTFFGRRGSEWVAEGTIEIALEAVPFPTDICAPRSP